MSSKRVRKAYKRMLEDIRAGRIQAVVAYLSSRLYRRVANLQELVDLAREHGLKSRRWPAAPSI